MTSLLQVILHPAQGIRDPLVWDWLGEAGSVIAGSSHPCQALFHSRSRDQLRELPLLIVTKDGMVNRAEILSKKRQAGVTSAAREGPGGPGRPLPQPIAAASGAAKNQPSRAVVYSFAFHAGAVSYIVWLSHCESPSLLP